MSKTPTTCVLYTTNHPLFLSLFLPSSFCNPQTKTTPLPPPRLISASVSPHRQLLVLSLFFLPVLFFLPLLLRGELKAAMVSIRRRKLLGLCSGRNSFLAPVSPILEQGLTPQSADNGKPVSVHPLPWDYSHKPKEETSLETGPGSSNMSAASIASIQHFPEVKRRKRHRRKHVENQEPCIMRGVYFKNLKWQAAIKVDKKQIHLGTVGSQEEAARLYDRAAFMCGREPNFDISEEEKQELRKFNWDEFLAVTRSAITNKKSQRRSGSTGPRRKLQDNEWEGEQGRSGASASDEETLAP